MSDATATGPPPGGGPQNPKPTTTEPSSEIREDTTPAPGTTAATAPTTTGTRPKIPPAVPPKGAARLYPDVGANQGSPFLPSRSLARSPQRSASAEPGADRGRGRGRAGFVPLHDSTKADATTRQQRAVEAAARSDTRRAGYGLRSGTTPSLQDRVEPQHTDIESSGDDNNIVHTGATGTTPYQSCVDTDHTDGEREHRANIPAQIPNSNIDLPSPPDVLGTDDDDRRRTDADPATDADREDEGDAPDDDDDHDDDVVDDLQVGASATGDEGANDFEPRTVDDYDDIDLDMQRAPLHHYAMRVAVILAFDKTMHEWNLGKMSTMTGYLVLVLNYYETLRLSGVLLNIAISYQDYMTSLFPEGMTAINYLINEGLTTLRLEINHLRSRPDIDVHDKDLVMSNFKLVEAMREAVRQLSHRTAETYQIQDDTRSVVSFQSSVIVPNDQTQAQKNALINRLLEILVDQGVVLYAFCANELTDDEWAARQHLAQSAMTGACDHYRKYLLNFWRDSRRRRARDYRTPVTAETQKVPAPAAPPVSLPMTSVDLSGTFSVPPPPIPTTRNVRINPAASRHTYPPPPPPSGGRALPSARNRRSARRSRDTGTGTTTTQSTYTTPTSRLHGFNPSMDATFNMNQTGSAVPSGINLDPNATAADLSRLAASDEGTIQDAVAIARAALALSLNKTTTDANSSLEHKEKSLPGDEKYRFYNGLPAPWNVQPDKDGKYNDEFNKIKLLITEAGRDGSRLDRFDGTEEKYYSWRPVVIHQIHERNVSIKDKYNAIMQLLKRNSDALIDGLLNEADPTPENYRHVILQLEMHYGGPRRAYTHAARKLKMMRKLNVDNFDSVSEYYNGVRQFITFCRTHQLEECVKPGQTAYNLIKGFMTNYQIEQMFLFCSAQNINQPNGSLFQVEAYLAKLLEISRNAREIIGWQRLPSNRSKNSFNTNSEKTRRTFTANIKTTTGNSQASDTEDEIDNGPSGTVSPPTEISDAQYEHDNVYLCKDNDPDDPPEVEDGNDVPPLQPGDEIADGIITTNTEYKVLTMVGNFKMPACPNCPKQQHLLFRCEVFKKASLKQRLNLLKKEKRCFNCLGKGHGVRTCTSTGRCQNCRRQHHTMICSDSAKTNEDKKFFKDLTEQQNKTQEGKNDRKD